MPATKVFTKSGLEQYNVISVQASAAVRAQCFSQDSTSRPSPIRDHIIKERPDSLATHIPQTRGFINDYVRLFNENEVGVLDSLVRDYEKKTTVEICVAIVDSTMVGGQDLEVYSLVMFRIWGVGKKEKSNGILIVISPDLRRIRIQNGDGIEKFLSDTETKKIMDHYFIPRFKEAKYFEGTRDGIIAIKDRLKKNGL